LPGRLDDAVDTWRPAPSHEATWWSIIFPAGMYAVACLTLGKADNLPVLGGIGAAWLWVACAVWLTVFVSMCRHLWRTLIRRGFPQRGSRDGNEGRGAARIVSGGTVVMRIIGGSRIIHQVSTKVSSPWNSVC
jgi:Voltage-dependent anion channel